MKDKDLVLLGWGVKGGRVKLTEEEVNFLNAMASGAVHLTGILPPRVVYAPSTADSEISLKLVRFSEFVLYSALLHLLPLRFHFADGC